MDLPLLSGSRPTDIAVTGWHGLTVRVAWALLSEGIRVRPQTLRDARDHVFFHLDPATTLGQAEDQADGLTRHFVHRARRSQIADPWPMDSAMPLSPRWRKALDQSLRSLSASVFRRHYGDARPLADLEKSLQVDRVALEGGRGGLREVIRQAAKRDGLPLDQWSNERIDRLLQRLAAFAPNPCPPNQEVLDGEHREHVRDCARCTRTIRLIRAGILCAEELEPPLGTARPTNEASITALHFHPEGRAHRARIAQEVGVPSMPVGEDLLLIDATDPEPLKELLQLATEVGAPHRDHLRGVSLKGPGRWSRHGLLGPLVDRAGLSVRSRSWGTVDGLGELPAPLPGPPSARRAWWAVAAIAAIAAIAVQTAIDARPSSADYPVEVSFSTGRGGVWTEFDVNDKARVTLVREAEDELDIDVGSEDVADKAAFAVGDGSYRLHTMGPGVLLASSSRPLPDLGPMIQSAAGNADSLEDLAERIRASDPRADVRVFRGP